jgi:hypothetical protein
VRKQASDLQLCDCASLIRPRSRAHFAVSTGFGRIQSVTGAESDSQTRRVAPRRVRWASARMIDALGGNPATLRVAVGGLASLDQVGGVRRPGWPRGGVGRTRGGIGRVVTG